jgi:hypothetical protein
MEIKYFTIQKYNLQKKVSKRNQNPSRYHNSITNLKFSTQAKISTSKNPHIKSGHFCVHPIGHKTTFHMKSNGQTFSRLYMMCHVNRDTLCPFYHKHINTSNNQSIRINASNNQSIYLKSPFYIFLL